MKCIHGSLRTLVTVYLGCPSGDTRTQSMGHRAVLAYQENYQLLSSGFATPNE